LNIEGASVLITGAAGALGTAFSLELASRGAEIMACDVRLDALGGLRELARGKALKLETCQADVTEEKDVEKLFQVFMERFGRLDAVINNAGVAEDGLLVKYKGDLLEKFPLPRWRRGLEINLTGVFLCGREAAYHMIRQGGGGVIVNISSISRYGNFIQSNYSATKAAVVALTVVWAKELSRYGIRSVVLAPGYIDTPLTGKIPDEVRGRINQQIPLARMGRLDEVTHALRFAIENDYFNGRVIDLDGGLRI
jgi:3-oxoacyl-[acyl-carrier protein] reductase